MKAGGPLENLTNTGIGTTSLSNFSVIIPPKGGHGYDVYRELGAYRALLYSRFETIETNPDIIEGNDFARVGVIKNPTIFGSNTELLETSQVSGLKAIKMSGVTTATTYAVDSEISQTVGLGSTAIGYVASWDNISGVLKYYQPMGLASSETGYKIIPFTSTPDAGYGLTISGETVTGPLLSVNTDFNGVSTSINNRTYQLGLNFVAGIASAEYNTKSGEIIYIDNRPLFLDLQVRKKTSRLFWSSKEKMPQNTNLNSSPYFDDFSESNNYQRVLFKPGLPIQSRELTTLQSILQNQIEKFGQAYVQRGICSYSWTGCV